MILLSPSPNLCVCDDSCGRIFLSLSEEGFTCSSQISPALLEWLRSYAQGRPLPLDERWFLKNPYSSFETSIWKTLLQIPFGETVSYKTIAERIGKPLASQAVGNAIGRNPCPLYVPCHRVIKKNGGIGGFSLGVEIKQRLLDFEQLTEKKKPVFG